MSSFWKGRRVLVTGHTGFKGSWLAFWLHRLGARVWGIALAPDTRPALFDQLGLADVVDHRIGDIRDPRTIEERVADSDPEVIFHLAAQPLVIASYRTPVETWATNVMGSLHVMEAVRTLPGRRAVVMVATDKVYENAETGEPFAEDAPLGGHDPYSASKAAMEIAVSSWRRSFLAQTDVRMASARAGNVIGGGDWAADRILPDIARALSRGQPVAVRNPGAVRPWQHVLDPLAGYLRLAERLWTSDDPRLCSAFNFGPDPEDARSVSDLVTAALRHWPGTWENRSPADAPHEARFLRLNARRARDLLGVMPRWHFDEAVARTVCWYRDVMAGASAVDLTAAQIEAFGAP